jgi:hypothetical protein
VALPDPPVGALVQKALNVANEIVAPALVREYCLKYNGAKNARLNRVIRYKLDGQLVKRAGG